MNASFGIDHPLIAVNNIEAVRRRFESMGFRMTETGKHPWGTSTTLAMFEGSLIEIMGIYDDTLIDVNPAGDFHFGRHIHKHLQQREGVALSALHSTDIVADIDHAKQANLTLSGTLEFGRDVTLPDGGHDRTKTTLALLPDTEYPRLSFFLCQQHRPELIYVPEWMNHPNTVYGYAGINILAERNEHEALFKKFNKIYSNAVNTPSGFSVNTSNGKIQVSNRKAIETELGKLPHKLNTKNEPAIIAIDLYCRDIKTLQEFFSKSGLPHTRPAANPYNNSRSLLLTDPALTGNTFFRFIEQ